MRKFLQLTLLLSCLLMLSHSINIVGNLDIWTTGYSLEESFNDIDLDGTLSPSVLFTASHALVGQLFFFERNSKEVRFTYGFIRAPPTYNL